MEQLVNVDIIVNNLYKSGVNYEKCGENYNSVEQIVNVETIVKSRKKL